MRRRIFPLSALLALAIAGCSGQPAPDVAMASAPTGLWIGQTNTDVTLDIQDGGFFKITRGATEMTGTWISEGEGKMKVTLQGQDFDVPYQRRDLSLQITLPGEQAPSDFGQM